MKKQLVANDNPMNLIFMLSRLHFYMFKWFFFLWIGKINFYWDCFFLFLILFTGFVLRWLYFRFLPNWNFRLFKQSFKQFFKKSSYFVRLLVFTEQFFFYIINFVFFIDWADLIIVIFYFRQWFCAVSLKV